MAAKRLIAQRILDGSKGEYNLARQFRASPSGPTQALSRGACLLALGRSSDARIVIDLARVSRHHARVLVEGARAVLEDLGSKNGTFLRGQPVTTAAELADGDEICIGAAVLVFRTSAGNSTTETGTVA